VKATVWGTASRIGGIAAERDALDRFVSGHSYRDLATELPEDGVALDLAHDGWPIGQLIYSEIADDDRVLAVGVLDDGDWLERVEQPIYFSPQFVMCGDVRHDTYIADRAELIGLSLTLRTKTLGANPVNWRAGDVRSSSDRYTWPLSWQSNAPLLRRALDHLGGELRCRSASATRIVDRRPDPDAPPTWGLKPGDPAPAHLIRSTLPNGLRVRPGKILRVS
jgi:hypothetical protein